MNDRRVDARVDLAVDGGRVFADDVRELADLQKAVRPLRCGGVDGLIVHSLPQHVMASRLNESIEDGACKASDPNFGNA